MKQLALSLFIRFAPTQVLEDSIIKSVKELANRKDSEVDEMKAEDISNKIKNAKAKAAVKKVK